ncbi:MAG: zinc-binding alcohol dehydrogenase [Hyphomicrobiaceae bacterium]|nr:zinc-binding alcohol dehydrogenase [Hyphomicrobiaceae bacterium]
MPDQSPSRPRRSVGLRHMAQALWYTAPGRIEIRTEQLAPPAPGQALVRMAHSAVSRGTERLVFKGAVPETEWPRMRAPHQAGDFPFPVKYGYSATGIVEAGPAELVGRNVFCLFPHQDLFVVDINWLVPVPDAIPLPRATLTANMETALNALWDAGAGPGDRIVVVGAGIVGLLIAHLAARLPGVEVTLVDLLPERAGLAETLGAQFATPTNAPPGADIVFHTTATSGGLETAIACAGFEATVVEMSWYGDRPTTVTLGGHFHSGRLRLISSQVGQVSLSRRSRWNHRRRMETAVGLLSVPSLDALVDNRIAFSEAKDKLPAVFDATAADLPPVITYL